MLSAIRFADYLLFYFQVPQHKWTTPPLLTTTPEPGLNQAAKVQGGGPQSLLLVANDSVVQGTGVYRLFAVVHVR